MNQVGFPKIYRGKSSLLCSPAPGRVQLQHDGSGTTVEYCTEKVGRWFESMHAVVKADSACLHVQQSQPMHTTHRQPRATRPMPCRLPLHSTLRTRLSEPCTPPPWPATGGPNNLFLLVHRAAPSRVYPTLHFNSGLRSSPRQRH
jgi:hypothetical protein